jgi:multimeric flavodoxin WrbA
MPFIFFLLLPVFNKSVTTGNQGVKDKIIREIPLAEIGEFVKVKTIRPIKREGSMKVLGIHGSPRRGGNTETLLKEFLRGCKEGGAEVEEIFLRELKISPCLEIYACKKDGQCPIQDDMKAVYTKLAEADVLAVASPIFFYAVSAHLKAMIDRCQALWARKYLLKQPIAPGRSGRKGVFLAVGGSRGGKTFDGPLLTMKYFFDALDMTFHRSLLYKEVDAKGEIRQHPTAMGEAYALGKEIVKKIPE